jgi:hypothetical protein
MFFLNVLDLDCLLECRSQSNGDADTLNQEFIYKRKDMEWNSLFAYATMRMGSNYKNGFGLYEVDIMLF